MSGTGIVDDVFGANVPDTDQPARMVLVNVDASRQVKFAIPISNDPPVGVAITWGPHHAEWAGSRVRKLTWEMEPSGALK